MNMDYKKLAQERANNKNKVEDGLNFDVYVEVKGYETERDLAKWKNIPNLVVFKLNEIKQIKNKTLGLLSALAHNELKP